MAIKFIATADTHLDSPMRGLERYEGAPVEEIRGATRKAFVNLVDFAINEQVAFMLIAGDLYDGTLRDFQTALFLAHQMQRLNKAGIRVFIASGNHDAASIITKKLKMPENVCFFSAKKPETFLLDDLRIAVHGQGYANQDVVDNLAANYPDAIDGYFNIGVLHTALTGREGHEPYAPCKIDDLKSKHYDFWSLGHVHTREVISENPWIIFPGNLQGRQIRETGPKGATLITIEDMVVESVQHHDFDTIRWDHIEIDVSEAKYGHEVVNMIRKSLETKIDPDDDRIFALRLTINGRTEAHAELVLNQDLYRNQIRAASFEIGENIWLEKIRFKTRTVIDLDALMDHDDPISGLLNNIQAMRTAGAIDEKMLNEEFADLRSKLPPEYKKMQDALDFDNPKTLVGLLDEVEQFLIPKLFEKEH
ncbi:MAG: DNA repair exonuclease [Thermodesulfobacteriota bacterium]